MSDPKHLVYLDHAATTYLDPRVSEVMAPFWEDKFGNPSSISSFGRLAKTAIDTSRATIARQLHANPQEVIFTGNGTESDNLAILGLCRAWEEAELARLTKAGRPAVIERYPHLITTQIEHHAVLAAFEQLERSGYAVTYLPVNASGLVEITGLRAALRGDTLLASIIFASNEIGTIQPVAELAALCKENKTYFHTDACQAASSLVLDVKELGVDLLTINASKIYGPKGIGALYVRQGVPMRPLYYGGGQELGLRPGTENVPAIVGFAKALELVCLERSAENERLRALRDWFIGELTAIDGVVLNGDPRLRLPNNINLRFAGVDGESMALLLDEAEIACATGSACDTANQEPSHVLRALGLSEDEARSSVRFTLGKRTSKSDLEYVVRQVKMAVNRLRKN